jgi:hypothetical protein
MKEMIARVGDRVNKDGIGSICLTTEELVRCKDCKHYDKETGRCDLRHVHGRAETWFCADGKRRTNDA